MHEYVSKISQYLHIQGVVHVWLSDDISLTEWQVSIEVNTGDRLQVIKLSDRL